MSYSLVTALLLQLMVASNELVAYQSFAPQKHTNSCQTTYNIICEAELVLIGVCLTRLSNDSEIAVYGPCPYVTGFTSTPNIYHKNYYHIKFEMSTLHKNINFRGTIKKQTLLFFTVAKYLGSYLQCILH